jgi:hypothetical protein
MSYPTQPVLPNAFHGSTTFNSKIKTYDHLAQRIRRSLGEPLIQIEISSEQIYENIDISIEWFTKFSATTEEYLIFRSDLYEPGKGLRMDKLFSITPDMYNTYTTETSSVSGAYDYDMGDYRKVVDVFSFAEGNNSGVNTLFTIEHTVAQQAYFGHLLGNVGYDLVTWHALKEWLDLRNKLLALTPYLRFSPESQYLKIIPEPSRGQVYYGLLGCRVLKPLRDIVGQLWVYRYAMALTKISMGHTRGKYAGSNLFGGQTVNYQDLMSQGVAERDALEKELVSDLIDRDPMTPFFVG